MESTKKIAGWWVADDNGQIAPREDGIKNENHDSMGDGPADEMGNCIGKIEDMYLESYGRRPKISELCKAFMFVVNGEVRARGLEGEVKAEFNGDDDLDFEIAKNLEHKGDKL